MHYYIATQGPNDNTIEELLNSKMVVLDIAQNITKEDQEETSEQEDLYKQEKNRAK